MNKANEEKHLAHPLYKEARELFGEIQHDQILKGATKYPEPLNPHSWTPQQLLTHMMQEAVDMVHYGMCLTKLLEEQDEQITEYAGDIVTLELENKEQKELIYKLSMKLNKYEEGDEQ